MRTKILLLIGAAALVVTTMACSGSDSDTSGTTGTTAGTDPSDVDTAPSAPVDPASVPAVGSAACSAGPAVTTGGSKVDLVQGADTRWYLQNVPATYTPTDPMPVVVDFHGYSEGAEIHVKHSDLSTYGDTEGFITISPQGFGPVARWDTTLGGSDLAFVGLLLDQIESQLCVDTNRVFVTGLSNGAFLTSAVACQYADRVAAAAPVAGIRDVDGCQPSRPVPVVAFHGTADTFVAFDGGMGSSVANLPAPDGSGQSMGEVNQEIATEKGPTVPEITADWAARNGCESTPVTSTVAPDVILATFPCPPGAETLLYEITDGGHTWPGSPFSVAIEMVVGHTTMSISANEIMWDFFQEHPLDL